MSRLFAGVPVVAARRGRDRTDRLPRPQHRRREPRRPRLHGRDRLHRALQQFEMPRAGPLPGSALPAGSRRTGAAGSTASAPAGRRLSCAKSRRHALQEALGGIPVSAARRATDSASAAPTSTAMAASLPTAPFGAGQHSPAHQDLQNAALPAHRRTTRGHRGDPAQRLVSEINGLPAAAEYARNSVERRAISPPPVRFVAGGGTDRRRLTTCAPSRRPTPRQVSRSSVHRAESWLRVPGA